MRGGRETGVRIHIPRWLVSKWLAGAAAMLLVLGLCGVFVLRHAVLDPQRLHDSLEHEIMKRLGFPVRLGELDYQFPDYLEADALRAEIGGTPGVLRALEAKRVRAEIDLGKLFHGDVLLRRLAFLDLQARLDLAGTEHPVSPRLPAQPGLPGATSVLGGTIVLLNVPGLETGRQVLISDIRATLERPESNPRGLRIHGELTAEFLGAVSFKVEFGGRNGRLALDLTAPRVTLGPDVCQLLPQPLRSTCETAQPGGHLEVDLDADVDMTTRRFEVRTCRTRLDGVRLLLPGLPLPLSGVHGELVTDGRSVVLREIRGRVGSASFEIDGYRGLGAGPRQEIWRFRIRDAEAGGQVLSLTEARLQQVVPDLALRGGLSVSGTLMRPDRQSGWLSLELDASELTVTSSRLPAAVAAERLVLEWNGDTVNVLELAGRMADGSFRATGTLPSASPSAPSLDATFTRLDVAQVLAPWLPGLCERLGCKVGVTGRGDGVLRLRPGEKTGLTGTADIRCQGTEARLGVALPTVGIERIQLSWDAQRLTLEALRGTSAGASFAATGEFPLASGSPQRLNVHAEHVATSVLASLLPARARAFLDEHAVAGDVDLTMRLSTPGTQADALDYELSVLPRHASFAYAGLPLEFRNITGRIVATPKQVVFAGLQAVVGQGPARFEGKIDTSVDAMPFELALVLQHVPLDEESMALLPPRFGERLRPLRPSGTINQAALHFTRSPAGEFGWSLHADVVDGTLQLPSTQSPLSEIAGTVVWDGREATLRDIRAKGWGGDVQVSGTIKDEDLKLQISAEGVRPEWSNLPQAAKPLRDVVSMLPDALVDARLSLRTEPGNGGGRRYAFEGLVSLYRRGEEKTFAVRHPVGSFRFEGHADQAGLSRLQVAIDVEEIVLLGQRFAEVTGTVVFDHGRLTARELRGVLHGGLVRASLSKEPSEARLHLTLHFSDVNVADFTSRLGTATPISGLARGQVDAVFVPGDAASIQGDGRLFVEGRELWQLPTLISLFNILPGRPSNRVRYLEARFGLNGGRAEVSLLKLLGDQYAIYGAGTVAADTVVDLGLLIAKRSMLQNAVAALPAGPVGELVNRFIRRIESATWQIQIRGRLGEAKPKMVPLRLNTPELGAALHEMQEDAKRP